MPRRQWLHENVVRSWFMKLGLSTDPTNRLILRCFRAIVLHDLHAAGPLLG
jgi:hypothetical protein